MIKINPYIGTPNPSAVQVGDIVAILLSFTGRAAGGATVPAFPQLEDIISLNIAPYSVFAPDTLRISMTSAEFIAVQTQLRVHSADSTNPSNILLSGPSNAGSQRHFLWQDCFDLADLAITPALPGQRFLLLEIVAADQRPGVSHRFGVVPQLTDAKTAAASNATAPVREGGYIVTGSTQKFQTKAGSRVPATPQDPNGEPPPAGTIIPMNMVVSTMLLPAGTKVG